MTLFLHRAPRTDLLAEALGELVAVPPEDPFAAELVVVPAPGVERWLSQRLSHRLGAAPGREDGVCAGVEFRSPWSLTAELLGTGEEDPWSPAVLVWPLVEVLDELLETRPAWATTLTRHLGAGWSGTEGELRRGRRLGVARRLARLFSSYATQRPAVLASWSAGGHDDGRGSALPGDLAWQPELWRLLAARVAAPSPVERHADVVADLRDGGHGLALPARLSLFGHTRLAATDLELVEALGACRDVHLWLPVPSATSWSRVAPSVVAGPVRRSSDESHRSVVHPLLATLGRDVRELQRSVSALDAADGPVAAEPAERTSLLGWLQHDLRADEVGTGRVLAGDDRSVQVHACHGAARQIEVLREVLLGLLADDPTLEPRDVLVMCPDIETYAPLIVAGFGLTGLPSTDGEPAHPAHRLRVQLADRALTSTNPLLAVAAALLDLAGGRTPASAVLDLAQLEPVRRRFGFDDDAVHQAAEWVRSSGVRWAFDAEHRRRFGLESVVANTWAFGLDRVLTGVAVSDDAEGWLDRVLPLDDVGSAQIDPAGRLAEYVARLQAVTDRLVGVHPLEQWLDHLASGVAMLTRVGSEDAWQTGQLHREFARIRSAAASRLDVPMRLPDLRALLADQLGGRPTRANFRTGTLTVSTMVPMRSVPHRVVCLVGLDDGVYPRAGIPDGDDVLARDPVTGERDARSEDRQLLLDAILAATETLVVTYTGADEYSGQQRPPAVPLGEVFDALDLTATTPDGGSVLDAVRVRHPLQPFDARNHRPGALVRSSVEPFSFDPTTVAGARAAGSSRVVPHEVGERLPPAPLGDVSLDDLVGFFKHPVKGFLVQRLGLRVRDDDEPVDDALPVEIDHLTQWGIGDRLVTDLLAGVGDDVATGREWRRGVLPPGRLGWTQLRSILDAARPVVAEGLSLRGGHEARTVDVDVDLGGGRRLRGSVPGLYGDRLVPVHYSRLGAGHRLQSWIRLLALAASDEDRAWTSRTVGRPENSRSRSAADVSQLGPLDHRALATLRALVELRDTGLCEPLPLPIKSSFVYARQRRTNATVAEALDRVDRTWRTDRFPGEQDDEAHLRVWPDRRLPGTQAPLPGEEHEGETSRFGALALRVWGPLLAAEQGSW